MDSQPTLMADYLHVAAIAGVVVCTALSGLADAMGFIHSARAWHDGAVRWHELVTGGGFFTVGLVTYWLASYHLCGLGIDAPEMQALLWFVMTIVGLGLMSGRFLAWSALDQALAVSVVAGLATLMVRVS